MGCFKRIWYLSPLRAAKVQASLRICPVSIEPPLLANTSNESRGTFRQKARSLAPLNGWAWAVKICHDRMLEDTNSLDGALMSKSWHVSAHKWHKLSKVNMNKFRNRYNHIKSWSSLITPGNVESGNQNYTNEILMGASGHKLQSIDRMSTNLVITLFFQISKRESWQFGNVVPNSFHFYTRLITKLQGKTCCQHLIWFLVWDKFILLHLARDILN